MGKISGDLHLMDEPEEVCGGAVEYSQGVWVARSVTLTSSDAGQTSHDFRLTSE
jgi:hypothetical protein